MMYAPDGFEGLKPSGGKAPARKFASAFHDPKRSRSSPKDTPLGMPARAKPPLSQSLLGGPSDVLPLRIQQPPLLAPDPPQAGPSKHPAGPAFAGKTVPVRLPKPPSFASASVSASKFTLKRHIPVLSPERNISSSRAKPLAKASIQEFLPPLPAREPAKPARSIYAIQPPLPPPLRRGPALPDAANLKTISTTRVAIATDPRTESGVDEIMALGLGQTAPTFVPPAERELIRGLKQSPEKASKSKAAKYIRGGLADRAQHLFSKRHTALTLWSKDMQLQAQRSKEHRPVAPDLALRIFEVAHITSVASLQRSHNAPRLAIVKCAHIVKGRTTGDVTVLLDFSSPGTAAGRAHTLDEVKEGKDLHIWCPYNSSDLSAEELRRFGALPRDGTTLFCTRFRIA
ncbi:hypothetical protein BD311DRAFT_689822 [Dichomitus squalens]|uniref:Uncharacterized protein n=1 Tax=Dichomitus squalens TaxID=114155 RepID=A0A4Q9MXB1_9APHY|nr:hypothetical protein BD311DRAFT_689822 [Dichomitus squalens]